MSADPLQAAALMYKLNQAASLTRARRALKPSEQYAEFRAKYRYDPAAFAQDCIIWPDGKRPADYQLDILNNLVKYGREAVRGPHGLGKTAIVSIAVHWFALTRDGDSTWKIPTTAGVWRQLSKFLWPEIHHWSRLLNWSLIGRAPYDLRLELQQLNLKLTTGEAFAVASDNPAMIEGAHADSLFYVYDEAKLIQAATFDAAEGAFSGAGSNGIEAYALATSTPGEASGRFYDIHKRRKGLRDWHTRHVTKAQAIKAGRISRQWVNARRDQWGAESAIYQNRVEGNFANSDETSVIPLAWIEKANNRYDAYEGMPPEDGVTSYGVDVARYGEDKTTIGKLTGDVFEWIDYTAKRSTMQTAGRVKVLTGHDKESAIAVDTIGVGAGVYDKLAEDGYNVISCNVAEATDITDSTGANHFANLRSAIIWAVREALDPDGPNPLALPYDDILTDDLTAPTWNYTSRGAIVVESKDKIRERLGRSTDALDCLALALYAQTPQIWSANI